MGVLDRLILNDEQWARMAPHIIGDERSRGTSGRDNRMFVETVLWVVRTGSPWRDLPDAFGPWNSAFRRFSRRFRLTIRPVILSDGAVAIDVDNARTLGVAEAILAARAASEQVRADLANAAA